MAEEGKKSRSTRDLVIRIVLFVVLIVLIIAGFYIMGLGLSLVIDDWIRYLRK